MDDSTAINPEAPAVDRRQQLLDAISRGGGSWDRQRAWQLYQPRPDAKFVRRDLQALCAGGRLTRVRVGECRLVGSVEPD